MTHDPNPQDGGSSPKSHKPGHDRQPGKYNFLALERALLRVTKRLADRYVRDEHRAA